MRENKTLVIVNGYPRSGKSTFIKYLQKVASDSDVMLIEHSTIDTVKDIFYQMGWNGEKTPEMRNALSEMKDFYTKYFDGPLNEIKRLIKNVYCPLVITAMREPKEIARTAKWCHENNISCVTVFVTGTNEETHHTSHSDSWVANHSYDWYVYNTETKVELQEKADLFFEMIMKNSS